MINIKYSKNNPQHFHIFEDIGFAYTNKNKIFFFDIEDLALISRYTWYANNNGYLQTNIRENSKQHIVKLSRLILNPTTEQEVDHIDHNVYDNRKSNLRVSTASQNQYNQVLHKNNTSGYKGVHKNGRNWRAIIAVDKKKICLGTYKNVEDAAKAYKDAAAILTTTNYFM